MAVSLTTVAQAKVDANQAVNQIIIEIDGLPTVYGAIKITKINRYGDDDLFYGKSGLNYGELGELENSKPYISLDNTTKNITTQMNQSDGGTSSINAFTVELVDFNNEVSNEMAPFNFVDDILSREANVYVSFEGLAFPEDAVKVFNGIIDGFETTATSVILSISHPEKLKRRELLTQVNTILPSAIDSFVTTVSLETVNGLTNPENGLTSFVRIEDEIIQYSDISGNDLIGCTRGALDTIANDHDIESDVVSFYRLQGGAINLALQLMLSGNGSEYASVKATSINKLGTFNVQNAVFFPDFDLNALYGVVKGDFCTITGSVNGNNFSDIEIIEIKIIDGSSYIIIDQLLVDEEGNNNLNVSFDSQFSTLNFGCEMSPSQVDIEQHILIRDILTAGFPDVDIYIKDGINARDFISKELYYPYGMYQLPRKARASVGYTIAPLSLFQTKTIDSTNILNPENIRPIRSTNENFFNNIQYKFNEHTLDDKFLTGEVVIGEDSFNTIKTGSSPLKIEAKAFRDTAEVRTFIKSQAIRFLDRYQFAAEKIKVELSYQEGFNLEIGDRVVFDGASVDVFLYSDGSRSPQASVMEVTNKSMDIINGGGIKLELTNTAYGIAGRFVTTAPSTILGVGSSTTNLVLTKSFGNTLDNEAIKWTDFVGSQALIHNDDWTYQELVTIDALGNDTLAISGLSVTPASGLILDTPSYDDLSLELKALHGCNSPQVAVVTGAINSVDVAPGDVGKFFIGTSVQVHNDDYTDSKQTTVIDITGNTITVKDEFGFTPLLDYKIDLIGFASDSGKPYLYI